jgi:hypothetical protein
MTKLDIMNNVTRTFSRAGLHLKKHSPEILLVAGVVGTVASAVMACRATTKISAILDETKENVDVIHQYMENEELAESGEYTPEDGKKDLTIVYAQTGLKLAKLYGPSIILGALSITGILVSHNVLHKRNLALAAAYATVDNSFKAYRQRVVERFGEQLDRELKYNIRAKEIEETTVNEDGSESTVKKTVNVVSGPQEYSEYARIFHEGNTGWEKDAEHNLYFLHCMQNLANEQLRTKGHLFLNEVYDMLGFPRSRAGQQVGWVYDPSDETRDNYVSFGLYDVYSDRVAERNAAFVNGYERSVVLDFNVDGVIYDILS